jgi:hypothetical protein
MLSAGVDQGEQFFMEGCDFREGSDCRLQPPIAFQRKIPQLGRGDGFRPAHQYDCGGQRIKTAHRYQLIRQRLVEALGPGRFRAGP